MRKVILTVGTQAAGKSTFCERVIEADPSILMVSRDKILIELFGKTTLDSYSGGHLYAYQRMWEEVEKRLALRNVRMILDAWNGDQGSRRFIIKKLRELGARRVIAWYFMTPIESVEQWFWRKPGIAKMGEMRSRQEDGLCFYSEDAPRRDHEMFHRLAAGIDDDGFDKVVRVNPLFVRPIDLFPVQASFEF